MLVFDDSRAYGYGRKPDYFRWVTPMEYRLFAAELDNKIVDRDGREMDRGTQPARGGGGRFGGRFGGAAGGFRRPGAGGGFRGGPLGFTALPNAQFACQWTEDLPLHAGAMVLAGKTLFIAGPADLVNEEDAIERAGSSQVESLLAEQGEVWKGRRGALLWAVSSDDGTKLAEQKLDAVPRWDGMAAAGGRLYVALEDGSVLCMESK
jgi:hypothetical protein